MSRFAPALAVCASIVLVGAAFAGAEQDVSVTKSKDEERNTVYELYNASERPVVARVEEKKVCSGQTNNRKPTTRTVHVEPRSSSRLGRTWSESSCELRYRVVEARYSN